VTEGREKACRLNKIGKDHRHQVLHQKWIAIGKWVITHKKKAEKRPALAFQASV
jgi:hypothetical protein